MDYFSNLLESYTKLKKRTFKLQYIVEEEEGKVNQNDLEAGSAAAAAFIKTNIVKITGATNAEPWTGDLPEKGDGKRKAISMWKGPSKAQGTEGVEVIKAKSGKSFGEVADIHGALSQVLINDTQKYTEFVNKFLGAVDQEDLTPEEQAQKAADAAAVAEEEARRYRLDTLGGLFETNPEKYGALLPLIKASEQKNLDAVNDLCEKKLISKDICKKDGGMWRQQYIGGSNAKSLESKLFLGVGGVSYNPKTGFLEKQDIGPQQVLDAFNTNLMLLEELGNNQPDCDFVKGRVAKMSKNDIVLYTDDTRSAGIVIENGSFHKEILSKLKCDLDTHKFKGSTNSRNETKGRWNERFMGMIIRSYAAARQNLTTPKKLPPLLKTIAAEFDGQMQAAKVELEEIAGFSPLGEIAVDLDAYPTMKEVHDQLTILSTPGALQNFARQLSVQVGGLLKALEADDTIAGGTAQRLGGKVDNYFVYTGPDALVRAQNGAKLLELKAKDVVTKTPAELYGKATEALKSQIEETLTRLGYSVDDNTSQITLLSVGNKLSEGGEIKFGDSRVRRLLQIVSGQAVTGPAQPENYTEYQKKLNTSLQFSPVEITAMNTYADPIRKSVEACLLLLNSKTYAGIKGKSVSTVPGQIAGTLQSIALKNFKYGEKGSNFYRACTKQIAAPTADDESATQTVLVDLRSNTEEAEKNRKRAAESLQRDYLSTKLARDLTTSNKSKATSMICAMAGVTIMEMSEMCQLVTDEVGSNPIALNQNDVLRALGEARKNKSLKITPDGATFTLAFKVNGVPIKYKVNFERQKGAAAMAGHLSKDDAAKIGRTIEPLSAPLQAGTLHKYIEGQMKLLEQLLKETSLNHQSL